MISFNHITIQGFRRLLNVEIEMRPLMVLIGANGVGKTSFLDIFSLLAASAQGNLNAHINNELQGITSIITLDKAQNISIKISMTVPNYEPLEYELVILSQANSYTIEKEILSQQRFTNKPPFMYIESSYSNIIYYDQYNHLLRPTWEHNPLETSLSQVPNMFQELEKFRRNLASSSFYHFLNIEPRAPVRLPQPMQSAVLPGENGEDLVSCLYSIRETDHDRFEIIEDTLRAAYPGFERLDFPPVAAGVLAMTWKEKNFQRPIYMHQLSEGILRFLWLTALLQSPGLTAVTLIDEPEVSFHPELLSLLVDLLREASQRSQIIVATHSDRLVRFLEPKELVVMDMEEDGVASAHWADSFDLKKWLDEYSLDEIWRMNLMGGRA